jgi:hypothetical protein
LYYTPAISAYPPPAGHQPKSGINPAKKAYAKYVNIQRFYGDQGYRESFEKAVLKQLGVGVDISKRIKAEIEVLPLCRRSTPPPPSTR